MKKLFSLPLYGSFLLALISFSNPPEKRLAASTFHVLPEKSTVVWVGKKVTGEHTGTVKITKGDIALAVTQPDHGAFDIDLSSLTVQDVTDPSGNAKLVNHLKGEDFFNTAKFPNAHLAIDKITHKENDKYEASGKLTIKGITHPVTFPATIKITGKTLSATGDIAIDRTKYDIKFRSANFFENLGDKAISDEFTLKVNLLASI